MITDKSLPALPPNAVPPNGFSGERVTPDSDTPTELSPRPRAAYGRNESSSRNGSRPDRSPERPQVSAKESSLAPAGQSYKHNRNSTIVSADLNNGDSEGFFIPVALDPSPAPSLTPQSMSDALAESSKRNKDSDYFNAPKPLPPPEKRSDSQATPHIAFQEKGRQPSSDYEIPQHERPARKLSKRNGASKVSPGAGDDRKVSGARTQPGDDFRLQDAPRGKKASNSRSNSVSLNSLDVPTPAKAPPPPPRNTEVPPDTDVDSPAQPGLPDKGPPSRSSQDSRRRDDDAVRPSHDPTISGRPEAPPAKAINRKEIPQNPRTGEGMIYDSVIGLGY
jgi:hypothetical protein